MRTNIEIDNKLMDEAIRISGLKTKKRHRGTRPENPGQVEETGKYQAFSRPAEMDRES